VSSIGLRDMASEMAMQLAMEMAKLMESHLVQPLPASSSLLKL
jgi:hypothetical protein